MWSYCQDRQIDKQVKRESPEITPEIESSEIDQQICGQLTFDKDAKAIQCPKDSLFNKLCYNSWISIWGGRRTLIHTSQHIQKLEWIINLNVKPITIKVLEDNIGENLYNPDLGKGFLNITPRAQIHERKNWCIILREIQNFCSLSYTVKRMKRQPQNDGKYL